VSNLLGRVRLLMRKVHGRPLPQMRKTECCCRRRRRPEGFLASARVYNFAVIGPAKD